jgi:hypothetical protein
VALPGTASFITKAADDNLGRLAKAIGHVGQATKVVRIAKDLAMHDAIRAVDLS